MITKSCLLSLFASLLLGLPSLAAEFRGVILKADPETKQLIVEGRGLGVRGIILTFHLDKETQIQMGRKPATAGDLSTGRRVRVTYELHGDRRVALLITLLGGQSPAPPVSSAPGNADNLSGTLRRVSFTEREVVVIAPGPNGGEVETTVTVPADVKITKDQKEIPFDDLKEGDQVLVQVEKRDGKLVAKSIQLGVTANAQPSAGPSQNNIAQLRRALKLIDAFLQMMEQTSR
jgi:Domain of unknown function (DUF5666)